jgi:hypothetical protein
MILPTHSQRKNILGDVAEDFPETMDAELFFHQYLAYLAAGHWFGIGRCVHWNLVLQDITLW